VLITYLKTKSFILELLIDFIVYSAIASITYLLTRDIFWIMSLIPFICAEFMAYYLYRRSY